MNNLAFFASAGDERGTPQDFFDRLNGEFHFDLDAAASALTHKCDLYFGEGGLAFDALEEDWGGDGTVVFLNPPYSVAGAFVTKAREEADKGCKVVLLLPVRSDTRWWHKYIWDKDAMRGVYVPGVDPIQVTHVITANGDWRPGVEGRFLPGRLSFELTVPIETRDAVKAEFAKYDSDTDETCIAILKAATGLPKMALQRINMDKEDDELLDSAPFPSCVIIFTKVM